METCEQDHIITLYYPKGPINNEILLRQSGIPGHDANIETNIIKANEHIKTRLRRYFNFKS